jgi:2-haloacid dehalogenase
MAFDTTGEFEALTFDCYGTLIDWHSGVVAAAAKLPSLEGADLERLERDRETADRELTRGAYRTYEEVLRESIVQAGLAQDRSVPADEADLFACSMALWPPFADSHQALCQLASRFRLAILSNVDTRVLEASVRALDAPFEALITAEDLRSYKPRPRHFVAAVERLGIPSRRILHVCCSLYHDVEPAQQMGFSVAWINRDGETSSELQPRWNVPDLASLVRELV